MSRFGCMDALAHGQTALTTLYAQAYLNLFQLKLQILLTNELSYVGKYLQPQNYMIGVQRYAKKRIAIWKTHIAIYIVLLYLT